MNIIQRLTFYLMSLLVSSMILTSCRSHKESVSQTDHSLTQQLVRTDTTLKVVHRIDSVYRHDSTMVHISSRNDTVFIVKEFHHNYYHKEHRDKAEKEKATESKTEESTDKETTQLHETVVTPPSFLDYLRKAATYASLLFSVGCALYLIFQSFKQ